MNFQFSSEVVLHFDVIASSKINRGLDVPYQNGVSSLDDFALVLESVVGVYVIDDPDTVVGAGIG